jgi:hypothetical protein
MRRIIVIVLLMAGLCLNGSPAEAGLGDFLKDLQETLGKKELSDEKIIQGLKEALRVGSGNAVQIVSKVNGYYKNPEIKIPLPDKVKKAEKVLRTVGYGPKVDAFELSMNRAAEKAAPEAKALFWETVKGMSFTDARKILKGRDNEATLYFQDRTQSRLAETFKPIVHSAMSKVGVTRYFQQLNSKMKGIPFAGSLAMDLDQYVTDRALKGLFFMLAEEERKIRKDPAARVTQILKDVFGSGQ